MTLFSVLAEILGISWYFAKWGSHRTLHRCRHVVSLSKNRFLPDFDWRESSWISARRTRKYAEVLLFEGRSVIRVSLAKLFRGRLFHGLKRVTKAPIWHFYSVEANLQKLPFVTSLAILRKYNQKTKKDERDVERGKIELAKPKVTSAPKEPKVEPKLTKVEPSPLAAKTQDEWQKNSESHNGAVRYVFPTFWMRKLLLWLMFLSIKFDHFSVKTLVQG